MSNRLNYVNAKYCVVAVENEADLDGVDNPEDRVVVVLGDNQDFLVLEGSAEEFLAVGTRLVAAVRKQWPNLP